MLERIQRIRRFFTGISDWAYCMVHSEIYRQNFGAELGASLRGNKHRKMFFTTIFFGILTVIALIHFGNVLAEQRHWLAMLVPRVLGLAGVAIFGFFFCSGVSHLRKPFREAHEACIRLHRQDQESQTLVSELLADLEATRTENARRRNGS